ncbi:hypothetical protein C8F01DRAFT_369291 [Mycena amicta]|nr:hypothetical protein C8F01DRAFT_369291 [Mycena amicta]
MANEHYSIATSPTTSAIPPLELPIFAPPRQSSSNQQPCIRFESPSSTVRTSIPFARVLRHTSDVQPGCPARYQPTTLFSSGSTSASPPTFAVPSVLFGDTLQANQASIPSTKSADCPHPHYRRGPLPRTRYTGGSCYDPRVTPSSDVLPRLVGLQPAAFEDQLWSVGLGEALPRATPSIPMGCGSQTRSTSVSAPVAVSVVGWLLRRGVGVSLPGCGCPARFSILSILLFPSSLQTYILFVAPSRITSSLPSHPRALIHCRHCQDLPLQNLNVLL